LLQLRLELPHNLSQGVTNESIS